MIVWSVIWRVYFWLLIGPYWAIIWFVVNSQAGGKPTPFNPLPPLR